jgi:hypothetical protein
MADLLPLISLLDTALHERKLREESLREFQRRVGEYFREGEETPEWTILGDLAYDLAFYEPSRRKRVEAGSLYGDEELEDQLRAALSKLAALGHHTSPQHGLHEAT